MNMLLDSNIIIYAIKPEQDQLRAHLAKYDLSVSAISFLEVLGYHKLTMEEERDFREFFDVVSMIPISQPILSQAVRLRQQRKMSLGDAVISATAILNDLTLVTANSKDFEWIPNLKSQNPVR